MLETAAHKVKPHHLAREACLYVRQSSLKQVETTTDFARSGTSISEEVEQRFREVEHGFRDVEQTRRIVAVPVTTCQQVTSYRRLARVSSC